MIQYILECIAFQLVFLVIYDFFLKRETFFQWNRAYLIGTYLLSLFLPWVKIEAFKTTVPERFVAYPEYLWNADGAVAVAASGGTGEVWSWETVVFLGGAVAATLLFGYKMWQLYQLRSNGEVRYFNEFTRIVIADSRMAFSFLKSIFLGDKVVAGDHENIIRHELVHIRQRHTWDLLFFEMMRIVGWFNPLVCVYQNRVSELHEFIADAEVAKGDKGVHYEYLLSQVFQAQNISFINPFFKSSLIKKRIVMLQKSKSKGIWKLKYLALAPILLGILFYTSCVREESLAQEDTQSQMKVDNINTMTDAQTQELYTILKKLSEGGDHWEFLLKDDSGSIRYRGSSTGSYIKFDGINEVIEATMVIESGDVAAGTKLTGKDSNGEVVPFSVVDEVPIFPGCENEADPRACFQAMVQKHIGKNFRYPEEALEKGIQGRVSIMFTIQKDGSIGNLRMRGPDALLEKEAARIIGTLPRMKPGRFKGELVNIPFSIPITFKLLGYNIQQGTVAPQNKIVPDGDEDVPFAVVEEVPIFPGCENAADPRACFQTNMQKHISENFRYPEEAQEKGIQGRVSVLFIIQEDGSIGSVRMRGPDKTLEDEAARIIGMLPKMTAPGKQGGKAVQVPFSIPITFKLQGDVSLRSMKVPSSSYDENSGLFHVKITDGTKALPGANVYVLGKNIKEVTDFDGNATVRADRNDLVAVQYKGFSDVRLKVAD
ncbi:TonB family protein [Pareuzebyella sediminis]|uniref:TonB family protein n=1 Tax=Pareuzebyella sediminis TaxID=2607998 RepID=UPI001E345473|nr:TonB family protein [Pareuzebyella sediminis]